VQEDVRQTNADAAPHTAGAAAPRLVHWLEYAVFKGAFAVFAALPYRLSLRLGAGLGELFYFFDRRRRRIALINLQVAFPENSVEQHLHILRVSCRNLGRAGAEFCQLNRLTAARAAELVEIPDRDAWERAQRRAREVGGIAVTAHLGNWELLAYTQGLLGDRISVVHRRIKNPLVDKAIARVRGGAGTPSIAKKAAARAALTVLKSKGMLASPVDQNQTARYGVFVDFFGRPASTISGVARLAMRTGAVMFPVFLVRQGESERHRLLVLPEIEVSNTGDRDTDVRETTQRCVRAVEEMIRRYPEQWIWFHKRWRTRPPGMERLY
jgi:KDO2-lipid IV(A) lauroyltransferase